MRRSKTTAALGAWFRRSGRALPWRAAGRRDPYATWVAEVMLQQTRAEVVADYWGPFLQAFPNFGALARAEEAAVLRAWAGLGYYRRARLLHAAARELAGPRGGRLPRSAAEWRRLPGVGEYTAAAIAAQVHGEPVAAVDGNVKRVAARVLALDLEADAPALHRAARDWAQRLMDEAREPGRIVEALMELGATVCAAREPRCAECPLATECRARARGLASALPRPARRVAPTELRLRGFVARRAGGSLLRERREGWNLGLWEPPTLRADAAEDPAAAWARLGLGAAAALRPLGEVRHTITRYRIRVEVFALQSWRGGPAPVAPEAVALTGLARKMLRLADRARSPR